MNRIERLGTNLSPGVLLDEQNGLIELRGKSILEDTIKFYEPILVWLDEYVEKPKNTVVNIDFEYFNSSTSRILLIIFRALSKIKKSGFDLTVNWFYAEDDEYIMESGSDFATLAKIDFNFIVKT